MTTIGCVDAARRRHAGRGHGGVEARRDRRRRRATCRRRPCRRSPRCRGPSRRRSVARTSSRGRPSGRPGRAASRRPSARPTGARTPRADRVGVARPEVPPDGARVDDRLHAGPALDLPQPSQHPAGELAVVQPAGRLEIEDGQQVAGAQPRLVDEVVRLADRVDRARVGIAKWYAPNTIRWPRRPPCSRGRSGRRSDDPRSPWRRRTAGPRPRRAPSRRALVVRDVDPAETSSGNRTRRCGSTRGCPSRAATIAGAPTPIGSTVGASSSLEHPARPRATASTTMVARNPRATLRTAPLPCVSPGVLPPGPLERRRSFVEEPLDGEVRRSGTVRGARRGLTALQSRIVGGGDPRRA